MTTWQQCVNLQLPTFLLFAIEVGRYRYQQLPRTENCPPLAPTGSEDQIVVLLPCGLMKNQPPGGSHSG